MNSSMTIVGMILSMSIWLGTTSAEAKALDPISRAKLFSLVQRTPARPPLLQTIAQSFVGAKYQGGLLDRSTQEELVLSLQEFDCILFVETVLAIAQVIVQNPVDEFPSSLETRFGDLVQGMRYRDGRLSYCDRLHYFTDWVWQNQQRGQMTDITAQLGGTRLTTPLNFMTQNRQSYPQIKSNDQEFVCIQQQEARISQIPRFYVPNAQIATIYPQLRSGDVVGIVTTVRGLDVTHTGFVFLHGGKVGFIHASPAGQVVIAPDLSRYSQAVPASRGIMVVRPSANL